MRQWISTLTRTPAGKVELAQLLVNKAKGLI
jgi:hypothetical protein